MVCNCHGGRRLYWPPFLQIDINVSNAIVATNDVPLPAEKLRWMCSSACLSEWLRCSVTVTKLIHLPMRLYQPTNYTNTAALNTHQVYNIFDNVSILPIALAKCNSESLSLSDWLLLPTFSFYQKMHILSNEATKSNEKKNIANVRTHRVWKKRTHTQKLNKCLYGRFVRLSPSEASM